MSFFGTVFGMFTYPFKKVVDLVGDAVSWSLDT